VRGGGISDALGLAGFTNGEVIRNPAIGQDPYIARAFGRITVPLAARGPSIDADFHQLPGSPPASRLVITGGILSTTDLFETNRYANNTRTQFLNWALITDTAYDFAADTRGYTRGIAGEWDTERFAVRLGIFQMPTVANGPDLDGDLIDAHGDQLEVDVPLALPWRQPAVLRFLAYDNHANMGNYDRSIALAKNNGGTPDITATRTQGAVKYGFAFNGELPLSADGATGLFARAGWNDGQTESFCFTESDRAVSLGAQIGGDFWGRVGDRIGLGFAMNGLSKPHRDYLALGGLGFILGDGRLDYSPELILETYYRLQIGFLGLTLDYQFIADPGDNRARGPVSVVGLRGHIEGIAAAL